MVAINTIQRLYRIEQQARELPAEERHALRQAQATLILSDFKAWLDKPGQKLPKSKMGTAIGYCLNQWPKLVRYLEDGDLAIDNNPAGRDIRPFATGRKNWMFSNTPKGADSSAILYSLVLAARANGLNPYRYLCTLFQQLPNLEPEDSLDRLLPWNIALD